MAIIYTCDKCGNAGAKYKIKAGERSSNCYDVVIDVCERCYELFNDWRNNKEI